MPIPDFSTYSWADVLAAQASADVVVQAEREDRLTTDPTARVASPGYLALGYGNNLVQHKARVRLTLLGNPYDTAMMLAEADQWATGFKAAVSSDYIVDTFYVYDAQEHLIYVSTLSTPQVGGLAATGFASNSYEFTWTGHGLAGGPNNPTGEARCSAFPYWAPVPARGTKYLPLAATAYLLPGAAALAVSNNIWADFYGNKAGIRGRAAIQMNASAQRRQGF